MPERHDRTRVPGEFRDRPTATPCTSSVEILLYARRDLA
jgi:hypothetical protein